VLACGAVRRRLQAFHDGELPVGDQIAVDSHLEWCDDCARTLTDYQRLRMALRQSLGCAALSESEEISLQASVINQVKAEETVSFSVELRAMFQDMHMVYAGLGAVAAALLCIVVGVGMMRFATSEQRPDSLAAMLRIVGSPGSNQNPVAVRSGVRMPRALDQAFSAMDVVGGDALFMLKGVVTQEGRIDYLELLNAGASVPAGLDEAALVEDLMGSASQARFEPASRAGEPVAVNMVWIVAHTTVRAGKASLDLPVAKKRTPVGV